MDLSLDTIAMIATSVGSLATALGVVYLAIQVHDGRRVTTATLIHELEEHFRVNYPTYAKLLPGGDWSTDGHGPQTLTELNEIETYFEFFEKIALMLDHKALTMESVDKMYGFRFFIAVNNPHCQALLARDRPYWVALVDLCRKWHSYRTKNGLPIPNSDFDCMTWLERSK